MKSEELVGELWPSQSGWRPRINQPQEVHVAQEVYVAQEVSVPQEVSVAQEVSVPRELCVPQKVSVQQKINHLIDTIQILETLQPVGSHSNLDELNHQLSSDDDVKVNYQCSVCRANSC